MGLVTQGSLGSGMAATLQSRDEDNFAWANVVSMYEMLPNIIGFWPMSNNTAVGTGQFVPLTTPLTSTSWDGDAKTTGDDGAIDLQAAAPAGFAAPAGIKAVAVRLTITDGTVGENAYLGSANSAPQNTAVRAIIDITNQSAFASGIVPCDANGDIWFACSGNLNNVYIVIYGYWL